MPEFDFPAHVLVQVLPDTQPCGHCGRAIRLARKLARRHPRNRWCAVPASTSPGTQQLPATSVHTCPDLTRRTALRRPLPRG
jgi:hypothetical protein